MKHSVFGVAALCLAVALGCASSGPSPDDSGRGGDPSADGGSPAIMKRAEGPSFEGAQDGSPPVAEIGGRRIGSAEVLALVLERYPEEFMHVLNEIIMSDLADREVEALGIEYGAAEAQAELKRAVDAELAATRKDMKELYGVDLDEELARQGDDLASYRRRIEEDLRPKLRRRYLVERLARYHSLTQENLVAFRIVVADRKQAEEIRDKARQGASFGQLARAHSIDDLTRKQGGELPRVYRGQLGGELEGRLFALASGEISDVLEESIGGSRTVYSIYLVQEHAGVKKGSYPDLEGEVRRSLAARPVDPGEIEGWYHATIRKYNGVKRYYETRSESSQR